MNFDIWIGRAYLLFATTAYSFVRRNYTVWSWLFQSYRPIYNRLGKWKALAACQQAQVRVPAYQAFLQAHGVTQLQDTLEEYPVTSKDEYVKAYGIGERCLDGQFWRPETSIDESSGSSGKPYNWVRSAAELADVHNNAANYAHLLFGSDEFFTINAFSMGAWSTGINTGRGLAKLGLIKSTGPDIEKILDTLQTFGPSYHYILGGYPPFLKHVFDTAQQQGLDLSQFKFSALVGGEALSEGLRTYLEKFCLKVRSVYGLSDVQIGMAGETDLCVRLRQLLISNREFAAALVGDKEDRIPMVFQYNPLEYYLEANPERELIATATSLKIISPKVRYNTGDEVLLLSYQEMMSVLAKVGIPDVQTLLRPNDIQPTKLPFMVLFGRKNSTVSYMGANIYPQDIENGLYQSKYAAQIFSFFMKLVENSKLESRPEITLVLQPETKLSASETTQLVKTVTEELVAYLTQVSRDYAAAITEDPTAKELLIRVLPYDHEEAQATRQGIKQKYVVKAAAT